MLKIPYHPFLGLIIALGGTSRIGLHDCILQIRLIIPTLFISAKNDFSIFQKRSGLYHVALSPPSRVVQSAVIGQ